MNYIYRCIYICVCVCIIWNALNRTLWTLCSHSPSAQEEQSDGTRAWTTGHILDASAWKMTHLVSYPTYDILLSDGTKCKGSFDKIRRRFDVGQLVEVYMGRTFGWVYGTAAEELVETWGSDTEELQTLQVVLVRDALAATVPSFLVRSRPAITARI